MKRFITFALLAVFLAVPAKAYDYTFDVTLPIVSPDARKTGLNKSGAIVLGTEAVLITGIMTSLYVSWYSGSETGG